jgi:hypothetical protein
MKDYHNETHHVVQLTCTNKNWKKEAALSAPIQNFFLHSRAIQELLL